MMDKFLGENFSELGAVWCKSDVDNADLALVADCIASKNVMLVSVVPEYVGVMWPWLEKNPVKIMARFFINEKKITEKNISDLTIRIKNTLRQGASGAQVFVPYRLFADLVEQVYVVRDDLFFDKDLAIGINIYDINPFDWTDLYRNLRRVNASTLVLVLGPKDAQKKDFVGKIFAMMDMWDDKNKFDLHFVYGPSYSCMESTLRMIQKMHPELVNRIKFFVNV